MPEHKLWTVAALVEATGISRRTYERMIEEGLIKIVPLRKTVRIPNEEFIRLTRGQ